MLKIHNISGVSKTYQSIIIPDGTSYVVPILSELTWSQDAALQADLIAGLIQVGDGVVRLSGHGSVNFLSQIVHDITTTARNRDGAGNLLTSQSVLGRCTLDTFNVDSHLQLDTIIGAYGVGLLGSDGSIFKWLKVDATGALAVQTQPSPNVFFVVGEITSTTTTTKTVEKTTYTEQTVDAQRSLVSTSALDTAAGTGARTVMITYLDSTGAGPFTETVTLAGVAAVNTVATNICFIEKMEVVTVGSTGLNQGIINLKAAMAGGGVTIGSIAALDLQTFWCHHYVPTGKTMKVTGISCSHNGTTVGSGAAFLLKRKPIPLGVSTDIQITDFVRLYGQSSTFSRLYNSPVNAVGPARILMYVTPESASSFVYRAAVDFYEV